MSTKVIFGKATFSQLLFSFYKFRCRFVLFMIFCENLWWKFTPLLQSTVLTSKWTRTFFLKEITLRVTDSNESQKANQQTARTWKNNDKNNPGRSIFQIFLFIACHFLQLWSIMEFLLISSESRKAHQQTTGSCACKTKW